MKGHATVTITRKLLESLGACDDGIDAVKMYLGSKISTDPQKNFKLALALADSEETLDSHEDRAWWLVCHAIKRGGAMLPDGNLLVGACHETQRDAWITAQWLAWCADALATKAGR